jgi:serine phosphatase RsbU (regulator of sigma subunit)
MLRKLLALVTFVLTLPLFNFSQNITINGTVFSFKGDKVMLLKKAQKNVSFDGSLSGAKILVKGQDSEQNITTGLNGNFSIKIPGVGKFHVTVTKENHSTLEFNIEVKETGEKTRYESLFLILKQADENKVDMGTIEISNGGAMSFLPSANTKNDVFESNAHLIEKTILINKSGGYGSSTSNLTDKKEQPDKKTTDIKKVIYDTVRSNVQASPNTPMMLVDHLSDENIDSLKYNLDEARKLLGEMTPGSIEYNLLKKQIEAAERKIKDHEKIIELQKSEIELANRIILFISLFCVVAVGAAVLLFYFFRQKKKHAHILHEKNKNIQRINTKLLSSIRYASLIQSSFLKEKNALKQLFNNSFVYNRPKDILSGDFYWFTHKNWHRVVVVADCTGHGVPGALLTVLGHTMLEDIVNMKGEVDPAKILAALNKAIQQTFANNSASVEYGMDITVLSIKDNTNKILLSGAGNGLYKVNNGKVQYYPVSPKTLGPDVEAEDLKNQEVEVNSGDTLFLYSDGLPDQFGGTNNKPEKFNIKRFEKLLEETGLQKTLDKAETLFETALVNWMTKHEQIDDVCVVGIRL